jgi:hypothetical protein
MSPHDHSTPQTNVFDTRKLRPTQALIIMLLIVVTLPAALGRSHTPEPFDQAAVDRFDAADAEIVFLGNSLLQTRIDPEYLGELTEKSIVSMATDGTAPGIWYLQFANIVAAADDPPDHVFVFFHDDLITRPIYFTGAEDQHLFESLTHPNSTSSSSLPELRESLGDRIKDAFVSVYPLSKSRSRQEHNGISSIGAGIAGLSDDELSESAENFFAFAYKRDQAADIQQPKFHGTFDSMIDGSFLPLLIEQSLAIESDLTIIRVAARPRDDGTPNEPITLEKYSNDLADYLAKRNVRYVDMTTHVEEAGLDGAMYYDGYHLKFRFREHYTEFFAEWLLANDDSQNSPGTAQ